MEEMQMVKYMGATLLFLAVACAAVWSQDGDVSEKDR